MKSNKLMLAAVISLIGLLFSVFVLNLEAKTTIFDIVPYENDAEIVERQVDTDKTQWKIVYTADGKTYEDMRSDTEWTVSRETENGKAVFTQNLSTGAAVYTLNGETVRSFASGELHPDQLRSLLYGDLPAEAEQEYYVYGTNFTATRTDISRTLTGEGRIYYYDFRTGCMTVWNRGNVIEVLDITNLEEGAKVQNELNHLEKSSSMNLIMILSSIMLFLSMGGLLVDFFRQRRNRNPLQK